MTETVGGCNAPLGIAIVITLTGESDDYAEMLDAISARLHPVTLHATGEPGGHRVEPAAPEGDRHHGPMQQDNRIA